MALYKSITIIIIIIIIIISSRYQLTDHT